MINTKYMGKYKMFQTTNQLVMVSIYPKSILSDEIFGLFRIHPTPDSSLVLLDCTPQLPLPHSYPSLRILAAMSQCTWVPGLEATVLNTCKLGYNPITTWWNHVKSIHISSCVAVLPSMRLRSMMRCGFWIPLHQSMTSKKHAQSTIHISILIHWKHMTNLRY